MQPADHPHPAARTGKAPGVRARGPKSLGAFALATAVLLAPATTAAAAPKPAAPQLSIAVDNGRTSVAGGEALRYTVTVTNLGAAAVTDLTLTQTIPAGATGVSADARGKRSGEKVTWRVRVKAAAKETVHVSLKAPASPPQELLRLATVVCAQVDPKGPPLVCASDSDLLPAGAAAQAAANEASSAGSLPREWEVRWVASAAGLVVAGLLAVVLLRRRGAQPRQT